MYRVWHRASALKFGVDSNKLYKCQCLKITLKNSENCMKIPKIPVMAEISMQRFISFPFMSQR